MKTIYTIALSLLCLPSAYLYSQGAASISGSVFNATTQQKVKADWVVLAKTGQGLQTVGQKDNVSEYEFTDVPLLPQAPYLIRAFYKGVLYSQNLLIQENKHFRVDVRVYDVTERWQNISVRVPHTVIARNGGQLAIEQTFEVQNTGKLTYVSGDSRKPTFLFKNPAGSRLQGLTTSFENSMPLPAAPFSYEDGMGIQFPIKPGTSQFQITYTADYSGNAFDFTNPWMYDLSEFNLFISPKDIRVISEKLTPLHDEKLEADDFAIYQARNLKAGQSLTVQLSGGGARNRTQGTNAEMDDAPVKAASTLVQKNVFVLIPFILAVLILILYFALNRKRNDGNDDWTLQRDIVAKQIADLDDSFTGKNTGNEGYQKRRTELKSQLKKIVGKIHKSNI